MAPTDTFEQQFNLQVQDRRVPGVLWLPAAADGAGAAGDGSRKRPLVLVGHGGTSHKKGAFVLDAVRRLVHEHGFLVAAIDGPIHGDRREMPASEEVLREEFRVAWDRADTITPMVADWQAAVDYLCRLPQVDAGAVGYYGLSMGTAYGLPLVAAEPRIDAAVLGLWGLSRQYSERLLGDARRIRCPVLFVQQWNDDRFSREEQATLFNAIAADDRRMYVYPGGHGDPDDRRLDDIVHFLLSKLTRPRPRQGADPQSARPPSPPA